MHYPRISLYALMLAAAGIPLYIHLPRFASVQLDISLAALGTVLLAVRLIDLVQDPAIGWALDRWPQMQSPFAMLAAAGLALGFPLLFSLQPGPGTPVKLVLVLVLLFSSYSLGMILLYGRSVSLAGTGTPAGLTRMATYRECGMLAGVVLAAAAPSLFSALGAPGQGYSAFGYFLGGTALVAAIASRPVWQQPFRQQAGLTWNALIRSGALRLLLLALLNSLPVAITSTLFLFFVEDRLQLSGMAGGFLMLFFAAAGISVPFWARHSRRFGPRQTLLVAMPLAIAAFGGAAFLQPGAPAAYAIICAASGIAVGADLVLLPVMFSTALDRAGLNASTAFGLWSLAGKLGLALAAATVLPLLELFGFTPGGSNPPGALDALTWAYALLPCILKLGAIAMVLSLPTEEPAQ